MHHNRFLFLITLGAVIFWTQLQAQQSQLFPGATWLQDVHFPGTVYAGVGAPVMSEVQAHFAHEGEIMFYLKNDVARAVPLISELHAQGKKYWVNLDATVIEGTDVQAIIDDDQGITDPAFGAFQTLEGNVHNRKSINRLEWRNFLISSIKRAIDAGADGSQHDGAAPPFASFDDEDMTAFNQYISDKFISTGDWDMGTQTFREYLLSKGKTDDNIFDNENDPQNVKSLIKHWIDFKSIQTLKSWQHLKQVCSDYAASLGKEYTLALNAGSVFGGHEGHVYWAADYYIGEFFGWGNYFPMTGTVAARSKLAEAFGKRFICWSSPTLADISIEPHYDYGLDVQGQAEMALIAQLYASGGLPQLKYPASRTYPAFYLAQTNSDLLNSVSPYGKIGVIMSQAQTLQDSRGLEGLMTVLQDINRSFEVIWAQSNLLDLQDDLLLSDLQEYEVIFLPEVFFMTDNQRNILLSYLDAGGTVVAVRGNVEYCAYYDELGNIQSNGSWEALVDKNFSGVFNYGAGRFINIAHLLNEPSGYPPSLYGLAYTNYKADPEMNYFARGIRDTLAKWMDIALPEKDVQTNSLSAYLRFFRSQDLSEHRYVYHVISDSVELSSREFVTGGPYNVALAVDSSSYDRSFTATWHSVSEPHGITIGGDLTVDQQTGQVNIQIPAFKHWGFVHLNGSQSVAKNVEINNLTINGSVEFRRLRSQSDVQAAWQVINGTPTEYKLEVWTNLNGSGNVITNDGTAARYSEAETNKLLKGATRVHATMLSSAATEHLIPAALLQDSLVYLLRVRAIENSDSSDWIKQFFYRNAPPGMPYESQIYTAIQNLWYYTDGAMSPPDTSQNPVFAFNKAPGYGGDFELDSLSFDVYAYTDSLTSKAGDNTKELHFIGKQNVRKLAWNESIPNARGDLQDTLEFSLAPYENFGIYLRAIATDGIDSSLFSPWFGFYLDNHNDPPNPFNLLEPANNSFTDAQIPFKWTNHKDPDPFNLENRSIRQVTIYFDTVATFDSPALKTYSKNATGSEFEQDTLTLNLPSNYFQFEGLLNHKKVYWKAEMWDYDRHSENGLNSLSRESSEIFVLNIGTGSGTLQPPILKQPMNNAQALPRQVNLVWDPVGGAESYSIQMARDPDFQQVVINIPNHNGTMFFVDHLENNKTYYWRVRAQNINEQSDWSAVWKFTVIPLPSAVVLSEPVNDMVFSTDNIMFRWERAKPAVSTYAFEYSENSSFENAFVDSSITDTTFSLTNLKVNTKYWWRVRAKNIGGWGDYSESRTFTIVITDLFDVKKLPTEFILAQNYPNPFNPTTKIFFNVPRTEHVKINLYDIAGHHLKTLYSARTAPGIYNIALDMHDMPSGVYIYQLIAGKFRQAKKMHVIR